MRDFLLELGFYTLKVLRVLLILGTIIAFFAAISEVPSGWIYFGILLFLTVVSFAGYRVLQKKRYNIDLDGTKRYDVHSSVTHYSWGGWGRRRRRRRWW